MQRTRDKHLHKFCCDCAVRAVALVSQSMAHQLESILAEADDEDESSSERHSNHSANLHLEAILQQDDSDDGGCRHRCAAAVAGQVCCCEAASPRVQVGALQQASWATT